MCALGEIETEAPYEDRLSFQIVGMGSERGKASQEKYDWENEGHGYERDEIIAALDGALQ